MQRKKKGKRYQYKKEETKSIICEIRSFSITPYKGFSSCMGSYILFKKNFFCLFYLEKRGRERENLLSFVSLSRYCAGHHWAGPRSGQEIHLILSPEWQELNHRHSNHPPLIFPNHLWSWNWHHHFNHKPTLLQCVTGDDFIHYDMITTH